MPANTFGEIFRVTTFGESHGGAVGAVVDGCPPGLALSTADLQPDLDRRRPGQSEITTQRREEDVIHILSGVFEGQTTGTPILLVAHNRDARPEDYEHLKDVYRPSHADFTYEAKYGVRDWRGGGRSSARETLARVAAGAIARKLLRERLGIEIVAYVEAVGGVRAAVDTATVSAGDVEANMMRCPDAQVAAEMIALVKRLRAEGDSCGGVVGCVVRGVPVGLGEPVFDKLPALLGHALLSINAVKGFEIGSGFAGSAMRGSDHNDAFEMGADGLPRPVTNRAGGSLGGISSGADLTFRVAFKPTATIAHAQQTVTRDGEATTLAAAGRHDPCVVPRAVPIVEAMTALVLVDLHLRQAGRQA